MNVFEFVLGVLIVVFAFTIIKHRLGIRERGQPDERENIENERLRQQVKQMQERIHVLERIATDRGIETAAQIEALRARDQIREEDKA